MPFGWFVYYLTPTLVILAAVSVVFLADKASVFYLRIGRLLRRTGCSALTVALIVLLSVMVVYRSDASLRQNHGSQRLLLHHRHESLSMQEFG